MMENTLGDQEMVNNEKNTCLYCKEEIKPEAIKCKHCSSKLVKATLSHPSHEGVCPFCKESIKSDAIKCKHCKTSLTTDSDCGYNDVNGSEQAMTLRSLRCVDGKCRPPLYHLPWWWDLVHPADPIGPPIDLRDLRFRLDEFQGRLVNKRLY
jgi:hypothetical protein